MQFNVRGNRVVIKEIEAEKQTKSGIIVADSMTKKAPEKGEVVQSGVKDIKKGDIVYFVKYAPDRVNVDGEDYLILKDEHVIATLG